MYANTPLSKQAQRTLYPALKQAISGNHSMKPSADYWISFRRPSYMNTMTKYGDAIGLFRGWNPLLPVLRLWRPFNPILPIGPRFVRTESRTDLLSGALGNRRLLYRECKRRLHFHEWQALHNLRPDLHRSTHRSYYAQMDNQKAKVILLE